MVVPGLEPVAGDEITHTLGGEIKRTGEGVLVFRVPEVDSSILRLRTVEDVFLFGWGSDRLSHRAGDLERIERWTAREVDWEQLLRLHHRIRPKPRGRPTYHLVTQMSGTHGYRRIDARKALARGLTGRLPASWREVDEDAAVEIWLTIQGATAICGLRLSDWSMRHRTYKSEHIAASLRPTVAAALVWLARFKPGQVVLDPMCGAGTILAEVCAQGRPSREGVHALGGDLNAAALRAAGSNLRAAGGVWLARWDATRLPLPSQSVHRIVSNPPFGKQLSRPEEVRVLYRRMVPEFDRVLRPKGRSVLLVSDPRALKEAVRPVGWQLLNQLSVRILGQPAAITIWQTGKSAGECADEP
jgi:23S rRNA G2445 N2-methylase RlmL